MVERQYQLFQLNGHGLRVKANVEIFRGDILDLTADAADRRVTFMYRQQHDKDDQDADYRCGHNKFIHQIIYVMKMKIDRKRDVERINRFAVNQRANRQVNHPPVAVFHMPVTVPWHHHRWAGKEIHLASLRVFIGYGVTRKLADIRRTWRVIHRFTVAICQGDQHIGITTDDIFQRH